MEYRINETELLDRLYEIDDKICTSVGDEYNLLVHDHNTLVAFLYKQNNPDNLQFLRYNDEYQNEIVNRYKTNITSLYFNQEIRDLFLSFYKRKIEKVKKVPFTKFDLDTSIALVKKTIGKINEEEVKEFDEIVQKNYLDLSSDIIAISPASKGITNNILASNITLSRVRTDFNLRDGETIIHEFGHVLQHQKLKDLNDSKNLVTSLFNETNSIFYQMIYLDDIKEETSKKEWNYVIGTFMMNIYVFTLLSVKNPYDENCIYPPSFLLACYFYYLYKNEDPSLKEKLFKFNTLINIKSDMEILKELEITALDLKKVLDYYINSYNEAIKKKTFKI